MLLLVADTLAVPKDLTGSAAEWPCCNDQILWVTHNLLNLVDFLQAAEMSLDAGDVSSSQGNGQNFRCFFLGCRSFQRNVLY